MKIGDLIRVSAPCGIPFLGIVVAINSVGGALVHSPDSGWDTWAYDWFAEIVNESR